MLELPQALLEEFNIVEEDGTYTASIARCKVYILVKARTVTVLDDKHLLVGTEYITGNGTNFTKVAKFFQHIGL